jgi:hypothetical protein
LLSTLYQKLAMIPHSVHSLIDKTEPDSIPRRGSHITRCDAATNEILSDVIDISVLSLPVALNKSEPWRTCAPTNDVGQLTVLGRDFYRLQKDRQAVFFEVRALHFGTSSWQSSWAVVHLGLGCSSAEWLQASCRI